MTTVPDEQIEAMLCRWASAKYNLTDVTRVSFRDGRYGPYSVVWTVDQERLHKEQQAPDRPAKGERRVQPHRFDELYVGDLIRDILRFALNGTGK